MSSVSLWNRNVHYYNWIASLGICGQVLDVGCGDGKLARQLANESTKVTAIDVDESIIAIANGYPTREHVNYVLGDALNYPMQEESFDGIVSVATLHHMDAEYALRRFEELLKSGGQLAVVGINRSCYPRDLVRDAIAFIATWLHLRFRRVTLLEQNAPMVWPPPLTNRQMKKLANEILPGCTFRRRLHGRYTLHWTKLTK